MICALVIAAHMGGSIADAEAVARWAQASRCEVRIEGTCASSCTMLLSVGCVMPDARLGFHAPTAGGQRMDEVQRAAWAGRMAAALPPRLAGWYLTGPAYSRAPVWISGAEAIKAGARRCD